MRILTLAILLASLFGCVNDRNNYDIRVVVGRIISMPNVSIWSGSILSEDEVIYEFKIDGSDNVVIGLIPTIYGNCPTQEAYANNTYRVEYDTHGATVVYGDIGVPRHLVTRNNIISCSIVE